MVIHTNLFIKWNHGETYFFTLAPLPILLAKITELNSSKYLAWMNINL